MSSKPDQVGFGFEPGVGKIHRKQQVLQVGRAAENEGRAQCHADPGQLLRKLARRSGARRDTGWSSDNASAISKDPFTQIDAVSEVRTAAVLPCSRGRSFTYTGRAGELIATGVAARAALNHSKILQIFKSRNGHVDCNVAAHGRCCPKLAPLWLRSMQTTFLFVIGVAIVAISFAFTLSCLDHGITATVSEVVKYINP